MDSSIVNHHFLVPASRNFISFDDSTFVVISQADLVGYTTDFSTENLKNNSMLAELSFVCKVSYFWFRCQSQRKTKRRTVCDMKAMECCSFEAEEVGAASQSCLVQGVVVRL
jgi:hypothetical protein